MLGLTAITLTPTHVLATTYVFTAMLSGANEVPTNASTATGQILVQLNDVSNILSVSETFVGLTASASGAHIHCCAGPTVNAPIALPFPAFPAVTNGSYLHDFDLTLASSYSGAFLTANGSTATGARNALVAGLLGGQAYANIHDAVFPGGEIRGQLTAVPEPASWALMIAGFGLTGAALRRRRVHFVLA